MNTQLVNTDFTDLWFSGERQYALCNRNTVMHVVGLSSETFGLPTHMGWTFR